MLGEFLGKRRGADGKVNVLLLIQRIEKQFELYRGSQEQQVCFIARVAAKEESPLNSVRARIRFSEIQTYGRSAAVPSDSVGFLFFSQCEQADGGPQTALLEVVLFGGKESQSRLERCIADAHLFRAEYVPMWVWVESVESVPATVAGALEFSIENQIPIGKCSWQQILHLSEQVPQDEFLP